MSCIKEDPFIKPEDGLTVMYANRFCTNQDYPIEPGQSQKNDPTSWNKNLAGSAHPRTKIAPIIVSRPQEFEYWRDTPMSTINKLNTRKYQYPTLSGYTIKQLVDTLPNEQRENLDQEWPIPNRLIQDIQPGVYTIPDDYQPINSNIGISETPQFGNTRQYLDNGNTIFGEKQTYEDIHENYEPIVPDTKKPCSPYPIIKRPVENNIETPNIYNVYDPRFSGYGSDDRSYLDPILGQQRYFYDDVSSVRMPNYIIRSKIDSCVTPFGDDYGQMREQKLSLNDTRPLAEKYYLENNMYFRNDMMESLMRKRNREMWQEREFPKRNLSTGARHAGVF